MKKISFSLVLLVLAAGLLYQYLDSNQPTPGKGKSLYDEPKKADNPELFLSIMDELTTKPGMSAPDYPVGYRFRELEKAQRNLAAFRIQETYEFTERGPANVPGRTRGLIVDPDDPTNQTWFAGGVGGGIWKTTDAGQSWQDQTPDIPNLAISWIVIAESNHDILYAGTGEGWGGSSGFIKGNGILKSTDHGNSWVPLASTTKNPAFEIINRLIVDPNNPDIVLAATSTDRRYNLIEQSGIYKSTDGGLTWEKKYDSPTYVQQIIADPTDFNIQYAAESGIGVLKSTDAGETWVSSSEGMAVSRRVELAVSPVNTNRLYASAQGDLSGSGADLYFSDDAGATWNLAVNASGETIDFLGGQGWYDNTILAHPFNLNEVYVGGVDFWKFKVSQADLSLGNRFAGADEENVGSFFTLYSFASGDVYDQKIALAERNSEDFPSVEIRFGPDGQGGYLKQMAHRFYVPDGRGSGVGDNEYTYQDYVEVPFQVWDIKNDRQLMIAFRDQQKDGIYNLLPFNGTNSDWQNNSREYLYISNTTYDPDNPNTNMATTGGHVFDNLFFMWPFLPGGGTWDPGSFPSAIFRIRYDNLVGKSTEYISVADAYGRFDGPNPFFQTTGATTVDGVHPDHHNIVPIIHNAADKQFKLVIANDGGIYSSTISPDPGVIDGTWSFNGSGYNTSQFYAVDKAPGESRYIGGLQDNGTWMSRPGQAGSASALYRRVNGGDGFGTAWNYAEKSQIISTIYFNIIEKSTDGGASSASSTTGLTDVGNGRGPFITELEYYHADPHVVYTVGASGVWKSENFGDNWTLAPIEDDWRLYNTMYARISLANANIVWGGTGMSESLGIGFHVSLDAGESFNPVTKFEGDLGRASGFATHPILDSTAFALFSYAGNPKIVRTDDLGQSWYDISGFESGVSTRGFPDVAIRDLLVMPHDTSTIWAGTEIGIFESNDSGNSWHLLPGNLPAIPVWDMKIVDKEVVLGSHGRGIWSIELEDLTGHVYIPEITAASPTINNQPVFQVKALSAYDSAILFVNEQRAGKKENIAQYSYFEMAGNGVNDQQGTAFVRAYRDGRPFVSKRFNYELFSYANVLDSYTNDFNNPQNDDFAGSGFAIVNNPALQRTALQSTSYYERNSLYTYTLKHPVRVSEINPFINYVEIALVQPGLPEAIPGTSDFKDYVVVQGSTDGVNWIDLVEPYDASARSLWRSSFGPFATPNNDMVFFRAINLQESFSPGDEVIIRFVLRSDNAIEGWGWLIDNLKIQTESVIANVEMPGIRQIELYPNPVGNGLLTLRAPDTKGELVITLLNNQGQVVMAETVTASDEISLNIPNFVKNGVYVLSINGQNLRETHKLVIDR